MDTLPFLIIKTDWIVFIIQHFRIFASVFLITIFGLSYVFLEQRCMTGIKYLRFDDHLIHKSIPVIEKAGVNLNPGNLSAEPSC